MARFRDAIAHCTFPMSLLSVKNRSLTSFPAHACVQCVHYISQCYPEGDRYARKHLLKHGSP